MSKITPIECQHSALSLLHPPSTHQALNTPHIQPQRFCKICLDEEITSLRILQDLSEKQLHDQQLIVPCECSGSLGYVHQACIRTWIERQHQKTPKRQIYCQICKARIFFKLRRSKYCECSSETVSQITGCNLLSSIAQLVALAVMAMVLRYSIEFTDSNLFRYVLVGLICFVGVTFGFTLTFILVKTFVKTRKSISRIFSVEESEELGLRELRQSTATNFGAKQILKECGKPNKTEVSRRVGSNFHQQRCHFVEINPSTPANQL